jgi:hypothetical protein
MIIVQAAISYFLIVFVAGFILGTVRTLVVAPHIGELAAVAIELPVMLAVSWWACGVVVHRLKPARETPSRLAMGAIALALLLIAEAAVSMTLGNLTLSQHLALYTTTPVLLGLIGQLAFALIPLLRMGP